jgi:aspartate ammonia-lyase
MLATQNMRIEHDLLGDLPVPADAYWGVQTERALENFKISGVELRLYPNFIKGLRDDEARARPREHRDGGLSEGDPRGIEGACQEIIDGKLHDQFRLDVSRAARAPRRT